MKKQNLILLSVLFLLIYSCDKDENDNDVIKYPVELKFKSLDLGNGIITYTKDGIVESPSYLDDESCFDVDDYLYVDTIIIKSKDSAQYVFIENSKCQGKCLDVMNLRYNNLAIDYRADSIIFYKEFNESNQSILFENLWIGKINERLLFPGYAYKYFQIDSISKKSYSERSQGIKDFTSLINGLGDSDTLSILEYNAVYEKL